METFLLAFIPLFVAIDPIGVMPPSANSHLLDSGVDVETAQKKGNWKDRRMVTYYDKRPDTRVREAAEILAK